MVGSTVGPYEIVRKLGEGGMGEVFLGRDPRLQREVALKRITAAGDVRAHVLREARAAARLSHPHIAAVYDVLDLEDSGVIVMEYVDGESLAARIARGPVPAADVVEIGHQLASAVAAAHAQGVIHRDLKPANVQLTRAGSAKVLDFGVAKLAPVNTSGPTGATTQTTATIPGNPGTPAYMAPEQLAGRVADARSDVYGLGAVLYEMATGQRPYRGRDLLSLAEQIAAGEPRTAVAVNPDIPQWLSDVIAKALKRDPAARYQSAQELESALASAQAPAWGSTGGRAGGTERLRLRLAIAAAAIAVVAAIALPFVRRGATGAGGKAARPVVLAVLPVENPTGDSNAEYFGAGLSSIVSQNLGSIPGLTLLSRAATAPLQAKRSDPAAFKRELGADYVLDLMINSAVPSLSVVARLKPTGPGGGVWERTISGDVLTVEKTLLASVATELESRALRRRLSAADWARIDKLPTTSSSALVHYSEARALLDRQDVGGNVDRAIELLTTAVAADPRFAIAHAALADAYWSKYQRTKDPALVTQAAAAVDQALRIDPDLGPVYASLANMYQQTGRYEDAIKAGRRAIELQPDSDDNHRLLARVLIAKGDYTAAAEEMRTAIGIRPFWNNYYILGAAEYQGGNYPAALDAYRRTIDLNPDFAAGYQALGTVFHVLGDLPQAIGNYEHSVRLSPDAWGAHNNLGAAYYTAGRYAEALASFRQALALRPNNALYYRNIGDAQRSLGNAAEARGAYVSAIRVSEASLKVNPRDVDALGLLAICEARLGRAEEAERHVAEVLAIAPTNRGALLYAAQVHTVLNRQDAALRELAAAIDHGYSRRMALMDDDLKPLRRLPGFDTLVADDTATR